MKCIYCGRDSKYRERERVHGRCKCGKKFAFEPRSGDRFTDAAFKSAIDSISPNGQVRWGVEHLYYELCRRIRKRTFPWKIFIVTIVAGVVLMVLLNLAGPFPQSVLLVILAWLAIWFLVRRYGGPRIVRLDQTAFEQLWQRWVTAHGNPPGVISRKPKRDPARLQEADIGDYSFDRAVICDRARTVDLLIANNFHFENNCAILSIRGYPPGPFETVRTMLKRNPKLQVFALHDASTPGCQLAHTLANDPLWFKGQVPVTDVGIRPRHAGPFRGLFLPRPDESLVEPGQGISADERRWLNSYLLELAAIRPEQILKRLFRAINRKEESSAGSGDSGSSGGTGGGDSNVYYDEQSFSAEAGDSDGGGDSFG